MTGAAVVLWSFCELTIEAKMREIDLVYRTMFAELGQRCLDAQFVRDFVIEGIDAKFSVDGSFVKTSVKGRDYWYHQSSSADGRRRKVYVGPVSDPDITRRVEEFRNLKDDLRGRRKLVSTLVREAGLPVPERFSGEVVEALAAAGLFRVRGVLVGTVAFQCYPGIFGMKMPSSSMQTGDADFAQFHSVSVAVEDTIPPILNILRGIDPSFREIPSQGDPRRSTQFESVNRYKVEFLTPNRGSDELSGKPARMPALGGAAAQPLRFLDFLIHEPVRSVMLHRSGVSVVVPAPERYAVHKLIVASRRRKDANGLLKREKDVRQAGLLASAIVGTRRHSDLAEAYAEAWNRGPSWREAISRGISYMSAETADVLREGLMRGLDAIGLDPGEYGFNSESTPDP